MKKNKMVSQKCRLPLLPLPFFLPYWQLSSLWHTMMRSKPGAATSIKCCQTQMDLVLSILFMSSQDCFRSVNSPCMTAHLKSFPPTSKTILLLETAKATRL